MLPKPWQVGHAPNGLLKENSRGCGILVLDAAGAALEALAENRWTTGVRRRVELDRECGAAAFRVRGLDRVGEPRAERRRRP